MSRFFPKVKKAEVRRAITNFKDRPGEGLVRAYKQYKSLLHKCPHHDLPEWYVLHFFMENLINKLNMSFDTNSGGSFMELTIIKAWELLERIRHNRETWGFDLGGEGGIELNMIV